MHLPVEIIKNLASSYIEVEATTKWTFGTFKNFLSERTGIPFEELLIFKVSFILLSLLFHSFIDCLFDCFSVLTKTKKTT